MKLLPNGQNYSAVSAVAIVVGVGVFVGTRARSTSSIRQFEERPASVGKASHVPRATTYGSRPVSPKEPFTSTKESEALATATLQGSVETDMGMPISGVRVCATSRTDDCCETPRCEMTNTDGRFTIEALRLSSYSVLASRVGFLPASFELSATDSIYAVKIVLKRGGVRLAGNVVDVSGGPITEAVVSARSRLGEMIAVDFSDSEGRFNLDVPSGSLSVTATADGYSRAVREIRAPVDALQLMLMPESEIIGRVMDAMRMPVANVLVRATGEDGLRAMPSVVRSTENGGFRIPGLPSGRYSLLATSEHWRSEEVWITVSVGLVTEPVELEVFSATALRGAVRAAGSPCDDGWILVQGVVEASSRIGRGGAVFVDGLPPGPYEVDIRCIGAFDYHEDLELALQPVERVWDLAEGLSIAGIALTYSGAPLPLTQIDVSPDGSTPGLPTVHCTTDEEGKFFCSGLSQGSYEVTIGPGVPPRSEPVRVSLESEIPTHVTLRAHAEGSIRVRTSNAEGLELPSVVVLARGDGKLVHGELSGGEFIFDPLPLGSYEVGIEQEPGALQRAELRRPGEVADLTLTLPAADVMRGKVVDDFGQGVPDAWVQATRSSEYGLPRASTPAMTEPDGSFALSGLLRGQYEVTASGIGGLAAQEGVASSESHLLLRLRPHQLPLAEGKN